MSSNDPVTVTAAQIVRESRAELDAYIAHCKQMTPQEFVAEPASRRTRLSFDQQYEVITCILGRNAPKEISPKPTARPLQPAKPTPDQRQALSKSIRRRWKKMSPTNQALLIGVAVALAMPMLIQIIDTAAALIGGMPAIPAY